MVIRQLNSPSCVNASQTQSAFGGQSNQARKATAILTYFFHSSGLAYQGGFPGVYKFCSEQGSTLLGLCIHPKLCEHWLLKGLRCLPSQRMALLTGVMSSRMIHAVPKPHHRHQSRSYQWLPKNRIKRHLPWHKESNSAVWLLCRAPPSMNQAKARF